MDKDFGICGRDKEIKEIYKFVTSHVENNKSGILYLTGPPGTGKTMSVNQVLDRVGAVTKLRINCFKAQSSKLILQRICESVGLKRLLNSSEPEMVAQLGKKFSGRTSKPHLIVLDEMDQLPKSKNINLFRTIFSWTRQDFSKLIIIGIANTVNLTARCQTLSTYLGDEHSDVEKIIFKPYNSKDIKSILNWYLENDENFEEAAVDSKALDMISMKFARENGDIRGAINALRTVIDDVSQQKHEAKPKRDQFPTPPSTPPPSPCKEKTNLASVIGSVRKRQRESHYFGDKAPSHDKIVLVCLQRMCSTSKDGGVDIKTFMGKVADILHKYRAESCSISIRSALEQLESQGLLVFKKRSRMLSDKIILKASENEISRLVPDRDSIMNFIKTV